MPNVLAVEGPAITLSNPIEIQSDIKSIAAHLSVVVAKLERIDQRIDAVVKNQELLGNAICGDLRSNVGRLREELNEIYNEVQDGGTRPGGGLSGFGTHFVRRGDRLARSGGWFLQRHGFVLAAIGVNNTVWALDSDSAIYRLDPVTGCFQQVPGRLTCITCPAPDIVWGINDKGMVFQWNGTGFQHVDGELGWIAAAEDGTVVGCALDGSLWRRTADTGWSGFGGQLRRIAIASANEMIGVTDSDLIFRWRDGRWVQTDGRAREVAIGFTSDNQIECFCVNESRQVFHVFPWQTTWNRWNDKTLDRLSVSRGTVIGIDGANLYSTADF